MKLSRGCVYHGIGGGEGMKGWDIVVRHKVVVEVEEEMFQVSTSNGQAEAVNKKYCGG
jgi:hypothetical protein